MWHLWEKVLLQMLDLNGFFFSYTDEKCFFNKLLMVNLVSQMLQLFHGQQKYANSRFVYLAAKVLSQISHLNDFFFHELMKCDIWRIVFLKSKHHKTHIRKVFSPHEHMQCGFQTYFCLKKYHSKFSFEWPLSFMNWRYVWLNGDFSREVCVTNFTFEWFFHVFSNLVFQKTSITFITVQWFFSSSSIYRKHFITNTTF